MIYTQAQINAMCAAPWQYAAELRAEAKRRKLRGITSVTPICLVVQALAPSNGRLR